MRLSKRDEAWMREQIPLPLPREEVAEIHQEMLRRRQKDRQYFLAWMLSFVVAFLIVGLFADVYQMFPGGRPGRITQSVMAGILAGAGICVAGVVFQARFDRELRKLLRERGHEVCVACGYCLAGLGDDVTNCPECGAQREPMVEVNE